MTLFLPANNIYVVVEGKNAISSKICKYASKVVDWKQPKKQKTGMREE